MRATGCAAWGLVILILVLLLFHCRAESSEPASGRAGPMTSRKASASAGTGGRPAPVLLPGPQHPRGALLGLAEHAARLADLAGQLVGHRRGVVVGWHVDA